MPVYCFQCPNCAHAESVIRPVASRNDPAGCVKCGGLMSRDIHSEGKSQWSENCEYQQPVFSDSMGVHPKQVKRAQAIHPWINYQPDGRIRIDSPAEYRKVRSALGMVDLRKR